jgi:hypothetical protein
MILDMIQGCRYLRRSTDRWTLSKNSMTRLKDSRVWRKAGLLWECFSITIIYIQGSYLYPVLAWLLVDYEHNIWYLIYLQVRMFIHPFVPSAQARSPHNPAKSAQTVPLPNGSKLPTARSSAESSWRNLPSYGRIFSPGWAHKSDSLLYQILVLTYAPSITR